MKSRTIIALFLAAMLTTLSATPLAASNSGAVILQSTINKSGENDIYLQRVDGSTEMHLSIPGEQRDAHISGNLVVFQSQTSTGYDIFLYDLRSARLFQATDTPGIDEMLSDVVAGCDGVNRIVYANTALACDSLTAFINASQAQSGKKLTADQVKQLTDSATQIKTDLGCQ